MDCNAEWDATKHEERGCHEWGCFHCSKNPRRKPPKAEVLGSNSTALLGAKDLAIAALGNLQNEFEKLNMYHYAEMMEGFGKAINGATLIVKQTKNL
jgi:hypothetical protein